MKRKYTINVVETNYGFVEVEAETEADALERARERVEAGEVNWVNSNCDCNAKRSLLGLRRTSRLRRAA